MTEQADSFQRNRQPPRDHHNRFKYAVVSRALHHPTELVEIATLDGIVGLWNQIGAGLAVEERHLSTEITVRQLGDATKPVVMISLPPPERPNEAYYLCLISAAATIAADGSLFIPESADPLSLRMFGMERSVLPDGGLIGFVVEWTREIRHNYDAPDNPSLGAFWKAILEVFAGTRASIRATEMKIHPVDHALS
jgi:hypothetical protein